MNKKITKNVLVYAKDYIDHNTPYKVENQIYDTWVILLKY